MKRKRATKRASKGSTTELRPPKVPMVDADRITNLPPDLIGHIFSYLPMKDAIRTSMLSRSWRFRWRSAIRHLDFDQWDISLGHETCFRNVVEGVLIEVTGPIESFGLLACRPSSYITKWMRHAMAYGATAFNVSVDSSPRTQILPKALFSCQGLVSLCLTGFKVRFPPGFLGFEKLTTLALGECEVSPKDVLGQIIANSPCLTDLRLLGVKRCFPDIEISSSSLCSLFVCSRIESFSLKNCPNLTAAFICVNMFHYETSCHITDVLHGPCNKLQDLVLGSSFIHKSPSPDRLLQALGQLTSLKVCIDLRFKEELESVFCILRSSPALEDLHIYSPFEEEEEEEEFLLEISAMEFWLGGQWWTLTLNQLKSVRLDCASRRAATSMAHLEFCKFLLANSPILQDFTIRVVREPMTNIDEDEIQEGMSVFPRASRNVNILVKRSRENE